MEEHHPPASPDTNKIYHLANKAEKDGAKSRPDASNKHFDNWPGNTDLYFTLDLKALKCTSDVKNTNTMIIYSLNIIKKDVQKIHEILCGPNTVE